MSRKRNYQEEYRRRIVRGVARGLSHSQARGHPKANEKPIEKPPIQADEKINAAVKVMNKGQSLSAAAIASKVSAERLRRFLRQEQIGSIRNRRWVMKDTRAYRMPVLSRGRQREVLVDGYDQARIVGEHRNAVGAFVRTNDIELLKPFEGKSVRAANGKRYPLETDPNELHRIAAMDTPPFHEIYQITSTT